MKKVIVIFAAIVMIAGFSSSVFAQNTTAGAEVVKAISIVKNVDLHFGTMASPAAQGTVTVEPNITSSRSASGVTLLTQDPPATAAKYTVTGTGAYTYAVTLPSSDITVTNPTNQTMIVNTCLTNLPQNVGTLSSGTSSFYVGATLTVGANQVGGAYSGQFNVTVVYN
jgi:hypothetical protein